MEGMWKTGPGKGWLLCTLRETDGEAQGRILVNLEEVAQLRETKDGRTSVRYVGRRDEVLVSEGMGVFVDALSALERAQQRREDRAMAGTPNFGGTGRKS